MATGIILRSNINALLRPGLKTVFGDYMVFPDLWKEIYKQFKSDKNMEVDVEMMGLGLPALRADGAPTQLGQMSEGYKTNYVHETYGIGFQISRETLEDNQYESEFPQQAAQLKNSLQTAKNINSMVPFNTAFSGWRVSDSQPLCSLAHPVATGLQQNTLATPMGLNETAVREVTTIIAQMENLAGIMINVKPKKLLVAPYNQFTAEKLLKSTGLPDSGNRALNPVKSLSIFPEGYVVNNFLTNPYNWFVLTDNPEGFKFYQRTPLDIRSQTEYLSDVTTVRAVERYSFGCSDWRSVFGVQGVA